MKDNPTGTCHDFRLNSEWLDRQVIPSAVDVDSGRYRVPAPIKAHFRQLLTSCLEEFSQFLSWEALHRLMLLPKMTLWTARKSKKGSISFTDVFSRRIKLFSSQDLSRLSTEAVASINSSSPPLRKSKKPRHAAAMRKLKRRKQLRHQCRRFPNSDVAIAGDVPGQVRAVGEHGLEHVGFRIVGVAVIRGHARARPATYPNP